MKKFLVKHCLKNMLLILIKWTDFLTFVKCYYNNTTNLDNGLTSPVLYVYRKQFEPIIKLIAYNTSLRQSAFWQPFIFFF